MELLTNFFNLILYQPLFNALILLYKYIPGQDFGIAVIVLTVLIKTLLYPLETFGIKTQKIFSQLQPKIKEIQEKYKENKEKQIEETMKLYQKEKVNPFLGCFPLLIQIPILIALYRLFWFGFQPEQMTYLYNFISLSKPIDPIFLGKIDLTKPDLFLAVLAGFSQFFQLKIIQPKIQKSKTGDKISQFGELFQKQFLYFFPILTIIALISLPSALGLYWLVSMLFSIIHYHFVLKKYA